jgi:Tol biopolymer transport system component
MTRRRTLYLPALIVAAVLVACAAAVLAVSKEAGSTFPGKNGKIAFTSTRDGKTGSEDIYTINPSGTAVLRLTNFSGSDFEPAWSPDGTKIAFMSYRRGNFEVVGETFTLYTMNARGTAVDRLIKNRQDDHDPAWSPDGSKIAFARYRDGNDEIYTMNANGTGLDRLTHDPKADGKPAWSPDGNRIAFSSDRDGNPSMVEASQDPRSTLEIYTMNPNGQASKRLTNNHAADFNPDWQPLSPLRQLALQGDR